MPHQVAVTVIAPVKDGHDEELARLLERIGAEPDTIPFSKLADVHFGRLFVLEPTQDLEGDRIRSQLVLLSDVDAPAARFLPALVDAFGPLLDAILGHCDGYPTGENVTRDDRVAYLQHRRVEAAAAYTNTVGRSAEQIRQEAALHSAIEDFLDRPDRDWSDATAEDVAELVALIAANADVRRVSDLVRMSGRSERTLHRVFARYVGASPAWVIRRYRLQAAAQRLTARPPADVRTVAWELGYADQAHMTRECTELSGLTPTRLAASRNEGRVST